MSRKKLTTGERIAAQWHKEAGKFDDTGKLAALIDAAVRKAAWEGYNVGMTVAELCHSGDSSHAKGVNEVFIKRYEKGKKK